MCLSVPGRVVSIEGDRARVDVNGVMYDAGLALTAGISVGDWVLLHAGYILDKVSEDDAELTLEAIREYTNLMDPDGKPDDA
jgi:hydrogenase expression/formation protein HypC